MEISEEQYKKIEPYMPSQRGNVRMNMHSSHQCTTVYNVNCPHIGHLLEVSYMVKRKKYSIDFKLQVVGKYERGTCGYKKLARAYGLSRDTVRSWCLNPRLREITTIARKKKNNNEENDLEYYKTAALFWETYAKNVEAELAKQGKKNSF